MYLEMWKHVQYNTFQTLMKKLNLQSESSLWYFNTIIIIIIIIKYMTPHPYMYALTHQKCKCNHQKFIFYFCYFLFSSFFHDSSSQLI